MIHHFDFLRRWTRVERNPTKVGVAVAAVLLKADLRPCGSVVGIHSITGPGPRATDVTGNLTGGQACQAGHGHKDRVEFSARALVGEFQHVQRQIESVRRSRAVVVSLEFRRCVAVDEEFFNGCCGAVSVGCARFGDDRIGDVLDKRMGVAGIGKLAVGERLVRQPLAWNGGGCEGAPVKVVLRLLVNDLVHGPLVNGQDVSVVGPRKNAGHIKHKRDVGVRGRSRELPFGQGGGEFNIPLNRTVGKRRRGQMREVVGGENELFTWVNRRQMGVGGARVEIVRVHSPAMVEIEVDRPGGVVGPKHHIGGDDVIAGIKRVKTGACAIHQPEDVRAFQTINHSATIGVGVGPICPRQVLDGIRYPISVEVVRLNIIGGIVFRVGSIEVFRTIVNATCIRIEGIVLSRPNVS